MGGMNRLVAFAILGLACVAQAQNGRTVSMRFTVAGAGGKRKAKDASNIVAWLTPAKGASPFQPPQPGSPARLVQKNKMFSPHVLVVPVGAVVEFPNRDPFFHNVFSLFEGKRFDLGLYEAGGSRLVHFDRAGVCYIFCNIHPEMSAVVVVVPTLFYGVSDRNGEVVIPDVEEGQYVLHVWYEGSEPEQLRALTRPVTVSAATTALGTMHLKEAPRLQLSHNNKYNEPYDTPAPSSPVYVQP